MSNPLPQPVAVGIDGSKAAFRAAFWAAEEALSRNVALRLVTVIDVDDRRAQTDTAKAESELRRVRESLRASGHPVEIETVVLRGDAVDALAEASRSAQLLCVGWKGTHDSGPGRRGSTAARLAEEAQCSVAIVHRRHARHPVGPRRWVVTVLDEVRQPEVILRTATDEARLRRASVLALSPWPSGSSRTQEIRNALDDCLDRAGGVGKIDRSVLPRPDDISDLLAQSVQIDQLVIAWADDAGVLGQLLDARATDFLRGTDCSLLIFRDRAKAEEHAESGVVAGDGHRLG